MKAAEDNGIYKVHPVPIPSSLVKASKANDSIKSAHRLVTLILGVINPSRGTIVVKSVSSKEITTGIIKENHSKSVSSDRSVVSFCAKPKYMFLLPVIQS
jgi:hypothetical protein